MKEQELIQLIHDNLKDHVKPYLIEPYTLQWIVGLVTRECGWKVARELSKGKNISDILVNMKGDYSGGRYHGYSPFQIDDRSYPDFIKSGKWKDLSLSAEKCIAVLEEKRKYLVSKGWDKKLTKKEFHRAITAAYNCGQGNVHKALSRGKDVDTFTFNKDYSKEVFRYANLAPM